MDQAYGTATGNWFCGHFPGMDEINFIPTIWPGPTARQRDNSVGMAHLVAQDFNPGENGTNWTYRECHRHGAY